MAASGLRPEDYAHEKPPEVVEVWADNWESAVFFEALGSGSWSMGHNGPVGLRYETFREVRLAMGIPVARWSQVFADLRVMEDAALREIHR